MSDQMHLLLFHSPVGMLVHSWRRPGSLAEGQFGLDLVLRSAEAAEAAKFDAMLLADRVVFESTGEDPPVGGYEPLTTTGALVARTSHLGFIPTISTTFAEPYTVARMLSQLDHLSGGRVGWSVVTSTDGAQNFAMDMPEKRERYARADEFLDVAYRIWDAWQDDAVVVDRERGQWAELDRIRHPRYVGEHYRVAEALTHRRSPQGRPVIAQAGQSGDGRAFAAKHAEVIFTSQSLMDAAIDFRAQLRERTASRPVTPAVLPGIVPVVAKTAIQAQQRLDEIAELLPMEAGLRRLSELLLGADLSGLDLDAEIPLERLAAPEEGDSNALIAASRYRNTYRHIVEQRPTLRQLVVSHSRSRSHGTVVGTAETVADHMASWFAAGACDGFTIIPPFMPEGLDDICELLVPELQRRGLFRDEYPGTTLRDTLGLPRPGA